MQALYYYINESGVEQVVGLFQNKQISCIPIAAGSFDADAPQMPGSDLILVEYRPEHPESEAVIKHVTRESANPVSVIVLAPPLEFQAKKYFHNMGVSLISVDGGLDVDLLNQYISTVVQELKIFQKLREMRIAVVDDSKFMLEIIRTYFEKYGITNVDYIQNPEEVIHKAAEYDLFLLDLVMPHYTGEEVIYLIRKTNVDAIVIIITTYGEGTSIPFCLSIGADDFLLKPFDIKLFMLRISACISHKQLSIENTQNSKALYRLATRDALTGIYNRTFFIESFGAKIAESKRHHRSMSMILLDLDHFKNINDQYGHLKGDEVLKSVARTLTGHVRGTDYVCRWGGEEFCVLLVDTQLEDATLVAEKLRQSIEVMRVEGLGRVTASFGVTQVLPEDTQESLFRRIDNSLYLAKLTGRNKVVSNDEIFMFKSGLPVNIEWGPFFRSGHPEVDSEHSHLIAISNEIIQYCFQDVDLGHLEELFNALLEHVVAHFEHEENILLEYGYEKYREHKEIHARLVCHSLEFKDWLMAQRATPIDLAKFLIQEVVVGHIIRHDFEFFSIFDSLR